MLAIDSVRINNVCCTCITYNLLSKHLHTQWGPTSQWRHKEPRLRLKSPASRMFTEPFIKTQIKENIKAPRHWPLCGEFTGTGEFPAQTASYAGNVSIRWRHHETRFSPVSVLQNACISITTKYVKHHTSGCQGGDDNIKSNWYIFGMLKTISHDTSISRSMQSKTLERSCSNLDLKWVIRVRLLLVSGQQQILV